MAMFEGKRGKVVWMPTRDAENHLASRMMSGNPVVLVKDGAPVPELGPIFTFMAQQDLILATGHASAAEGIVLLQAAKQAGVRRLLVTHVLADPVFANVAQMRQMAGLGALMELTYSAHISGEGALVESQRANRRVTVAEQAAAIKEVGAQHFLISTDLGQAGNPLHSDGLATFVELLRAEGIGNADIDLMARTNPARLLGLDP
jgi:predicted metal-dependent phosphotriesterase family hydrolase